MALHSCAQAGFECSAAIAPHDDVKRLLLEPSAATSKTAPTTDTDAIALWSAYEAAYAEAKKVTIWLTIVICYCALFQCFFFFKLRPSDQVTDERNQRLNGQSCFGRFCEDALDSFTFAAWRLGANTRRCHLKSAENGPKSTL
jgi:hypothetical protein